MKSPTQHNFLARLTCLFFLGVGGSFAAIASADTVAYWRFEDGVDGADVVHLAGDDAGNTYSADIQDVSGNGNDISVWITGGFAGYGYRSEVPASTVSATGATNNLSVQNTGDAPGMFTGTTGIQTIAPAAFSIEASFKLENGAFRTVVGRDSTDVATANGALAAVYFQATPGNGFAIKYTDQDGFFHEAIAPAGTLDTWDAATETSADADWYHAAATSDGNTLSLYLSNASDGTGYQLVARTDLTASGSTNTAMTAGNGDGGDWDAGNWTVGRGLFNGVHVDRGIGFIDEVRIRDDALAPADLLHFESTQNLAITVDASTGAVTLTNPSSGAVTLDYYEVTSPSGSLAEASWNSLEDQGVEATPPGDYNADSSVDAADYTVWRDGLGTTFAPADYDVWQANYGTSAADGFGWTEAGGSDANILSELLLDVAGTTLAPGASLSLGSAYNAGIDARDLEFSYGRPGSGLFVGGVSYVNAAAAIPEPTCIALIACGLIAGAARRSC